MHGMIVRSHEDATNAHIHLLMYAYIRAQTLPLFVEHNLLLPLCSIRVFPLLILAVHLAEHKLIIVGLDNAGKTTILYQLYVSLLHFASFTVLFLSFLSRSRDSCFHLIPICRCCRGV